MFTKSKMSSQSSAQDEKSDAVQEYLRRYGRVAKSTKKAVWVYDGKVDSEYTADPRAGAHEWDLRIAINPNDIEKAVEALFQSSAVRRSCDILRRSRTGFSIFNHII